MQLLESYLRWVICGGTMITLCFKLHHHSTKTKWKHDVHYDGLSISSKSLQVSFYIVRKIYDARKTCLKCGTFKSCWQ